ncbi:MAG TPA: hypothetical protein VKG25_13335 [Bryobacteraceae bacterium]|nr:hypothetical protein [Bryobacteraceae bacterium]
MRRLQREFKVVLTFMNAEERIATPLARYERLWRLPADSICPPHENMRLLIPAKLKRPISIRLGEGNGEDR